MTTTATSQELNQYSSAIQRKAEVEPVIITKRGKPNLVLLSFEEYQEITGEKQSILDALSFDGEFADFDFDRSELPQVTMRGAELD